MYTGQGWEALLNFLLQSQGSIQTIEVKSPHSETKSTVKCNDLQENRLMELIVELSSSIQRIVRKSWVCLSS